MLLGFISLRLIHMLALLAIVIVTFGGSSRFDSAAPLQRSIAFAQKPAEWDRFTIRGGEFSVLLPTAPAMSTYGIQGTPLAKVRIRHIVGAYSNGVVYAVYVFQRTAPLDEFIGVFSPSLSGPTRELQVGQFAGKEYISKTADTKQVDQYFISKRFIYLFRACGSYLGDPETAISRFFDSIRFDSSEDHIAIVDGPGIIQSTSELDRAPIFPGKEVTGKARVITKPEPSYTEEARKNQINGTVVLRGVFSASGAVTNLQFVSGLPSGLSENAMAAAKQIRFIPAIKDGHFVSMYIQLEYNFSLY
jgi:TonB family protein